MAERRGRLESTPVPRRAEHLHAPFIGAVGLDSRSASCGALACAFYLGGWTRLQNRVVLSTCMRLTFGRLDSALSEDLREIRYGRRDLRER
jgi:hypothetical protein